MTAAVCDSCFGLLIYSRRLFTSTSVNIEVLVKRCCDYVDVIERSLDFISLVMHELVMMMVMMTMMMVMIMVMYTEKRVKASCS